MAKKQDDLDELAKSLRAVADDFELLVAKIRAGRDTTGAEEALKGAQAAIGTARSSLRPPDK